MSAYYRVRAVRVEVEHCTQYETLVQVIHTIKRDASRLKLKILKLKKWLEYGPEETSPPTIIVHYIGERYGE